MKKNYKILIVIIFITLIAFACNYFLQSKRNDAKSVNIPRDSTEYKTERVTNEKCCDDNTSCCGEKTDNKIREKQ